MTTSVPTIEECREVFPLDYLSGKKLLRIQLGQGIFPGYAFGWGSVGGQHQRMDLAAMGFDGVKIVGAGRDQTFIQDLTASIPIVAANGQGLIWLKDLTVMGGTVDSPRAIHYGLEKMYRTAPPYPGDCLMLTNVRIKASGKGRWGILTYNVDRLYVDVIFDWAAGNEHADYGHGYGNHGVMWDRVSILGCGAEGAKLTCRPHEVHFVPGVRVYFRDCDFTNWFQDWTLAGGAGIVAQGAGYQSLLVEGTQEAQLPWKPANRRKCLMMDDGMSPIRPGQVRFYDVLTGEVPDPSNLPPGGVCANGWTWINGSGLHFPGIDGVRVAKEGHPDDQWERDVVRGYAITGSGLFGDGALVDLREVRKDRVLVQACNQDSFVNRAGDLGWDTTDAMLRFKKKDGTFVNQAISETYRP